MKKPADRATINFRRTRIGLLGEGSIVLSGTGAMLAERMRFVTDVIVDVSVRRNNIEPLYVNRSTHADTVVTLQTQRGYEACD